MISSEPMHGVLLAVNPVPWARSQMAFTLAFHIILVPLGVSWAFMALIANYKAIKHDDADALRLAQRWSKYMAVTFAVGAVTGTVLTFEFGLLWPHFMGQWGAAFGVPFAFEGLFFLIEAIFVARSTSTGGVGSSRGPTSGPACRCPSAASSAASRSSPPTPG